MSSQERNQYSTSILVNQNPIDATEIVRVRLSQAKLLNDEFSKFFKNYYTIKSNYLSQLNRLVKDSQDLNKNIEHSIIENQVLSREELKYYNVDAIGHLSQIWNEVITEIKDEIAANSRLGQVVERDVINPLGAYTSKDKRWAEIRNLHSKLSEVAQTVEFNQEKVEKYQGSRNSEKLEKYQSGLQSANQSWDSEAPYVFEVFEYTDYDRLSFLRDSLLRFQTAYSDALNRISQSNEKALETILNFNPETEIERFAKVSSEAAYIPKEARKAAESPVVPQHRSGAPIGAGAATGAAIGAGPGTPSGNRHSSVSTTATTQTHKSKADSPSKPPKSKTKLKSKVGSIFGRKNKKNKNLDIADTVPESETSSISSPSRTNNRLSRASSLASRLKTQQSGSNLNPNAHHEASQSSGHHVGTGAVGAAVGAVGVGAAAAGAGAYASSNSNAPKPISKETQGQPTLGSQSSSSHNVPISVNQAPLKPTSRSSSSANLNGNSPVNPRPTESPQGTTFDPRGSSEQSYFDGPNVINVHDQQQGQPSQQAHGEGVHDHRAPPPPPSRKTQQFGSQNLTNIREDGDASFESTNNRDVFAPQPPVAGSGAAASTGNRRDIQSGLFTNLNQADLENHQNKRISSFNSFGGDSIGQLNPQLTGSSLALNNPGLFQHAALTQPGLNASIAEVINAKFKDGEQITSQLVGEIAFNYLSDGFDIPTRANLKIHGAETFDKIIPNNQFLKQIDHNEFEITPSSILSRTLGGLKYLIKNTTAPIVVHPVWRFEAHQASVMLTIKLAPHIAEQLQPGQSVEVSELSVSVAITGALATGALSKPQGTFNKEKARISWRFKDPIQLSSTSEEKLVARFLTTSEAKESDHGVVLKFTINNDNGGKLITSNVELESQNFTDDDPFAQETWSPVPSTKTLVAGSYSALA